VVLEEQDSIRRSACRALRHAVAALAVLVLATSCSEEKTTVIAHPTDPERVPTMTSRDVQTVISDDGHTRYRITTPLWKMYEEAKKPHWTFPQGVTAEELDETYQTIATIKCDSAYFDEDQQLWTLHGNVRITNTDKDLILTDEMMWSQRLHKIYSDAFIHIEKQGRVIEGYGYESNEQLTTYRLSKVEAIFPVDPNRMPHP